MKALADKLISDKVFTKSAYGALVNKIAVCTGFASGLSLIYHVAGIDAYCIHGYIEGLKEKSHIISYFVINGEEYVGDLDEKRQVETLASYQNRKGYVLDTPVYEEAKQLVGKN